LGNTWEDGDSPDTATSESLCLPNEGRNGEAEMTGKTVNRLWFTLTIYNEKRSDKMRGRDTAFGEKPAYARSST
jgi:hypothetical protein